MTHPHQSTRLLLVLTAAALMLGKPAHADPTGDAKQAIQAACNRNLASYSHRDLTGVMASAPLSIPRFASEPVPRQETQNFSPNPLVTLSPAALSDFDTLLPLIANQAKVTIICEGQPWNPTIAGKALADLIHHINPAGLPLEDAVKQIGAAYDYDTLRLSPTIILLTKRYSDPNEMPEITLDQALVSIQNILDATQNFRPSLTPIDTLTEMINVETPAQKVQLAQGITISNLPGEWQQMVFQLAYTTGLNSLPNLERVVERLKACQRHDTVFCYRDYQGHPYTAYQGSFGTADTTDYYALSAMVVTDASGTTAIAPARQIAYNDKIIVEPAVTQDFTSRPTPPPPRLTDSKWRLTLSELARRLNDKLLPGSAKVRVNPALARKTVCLIGIEQTPPGDLVKAICSLYGLEAHPDTANNLMIIGLPRPNILTNTRDISAEIRRLLPVDLLRAVSGTDAQNAGLNYSSKRASKRASDKYSTERASSLFVASVRRLRQIVEPQINKSPKHQFPVPNAGDEALDLIGISSLARCVSEHLLASIAAPSVPFLDNLDKTTFMLTQDAQNPNTCSFKFIYKDTHGMYSQGSTIEFLPGTFPAPTLSPIP